MTSWSGSACAPGSLRIAPLTRTRPAPRNSSARRRDASPAWARILLRRIDGSGRLLDVARGLLGRGLRRIELGDRQLSLDLRQVAEIAQAERHQELARGLVQERAAGGFLPPADADEPALEQVVEHALRVHAARRVDLRSRDGLAIRDDRQRLE